MPREPGSASSSARPNPRRCNAIRHPAAREKCKVHKGPNYPQRRGVRLSPPRLAGPLRHRYVTRFVALGVCLLAAGAAATPDVFGILRGVETRYNRARTLEVRFEQTYEAPRRPPKTEAGTLFLRKPGRMQWRYSQPPGKLFVSDGKYVYLYTPANNRVERSKVKESDDMRAPLAFLLGKLDFNRDFKSFTAHPEGADTWIAAEPRSSKAPYTKVEFRVSPSFEIRRLLVAQDDGSTMEFHFDEEKLNPALAESMFRFTPPPNAEVVDQ
jgi:outer membrane lipoprotein carrier protein